MKTEVSDTVESERVKCKQPDNGNESPNHRDASRKKAERDTIGERIVMFALNFYSDLYEEALRNGRKSATIRLGDKSDKYQTGQIVWVTMGARFGRRQKLYSALLDRVEVKKISELSPRDIERENPELRTEDEVIGVLSRIYGEFVTPAHLVTVIYFSRIDE
jgi:hypothetical protein